MTSDVPRAADVVVIGGGVHGASVAYHLARRGARRVVLDNTPDHEPVLGAVPEHPGLFVDFGWSGHGFKHAPAVGDILAQVVLDGHAPGWDLQPFRWSRFRDNALLPRATAADPPH